MPSSANKIKLGELLIDAGVITSGDLTEAIQVSRRLGVPIGQALLVSRCVTDNVLEASLEAQALIREGTVAREEAVAALRNSAEDGRVLRTFLNIGSSVEDNAQTSKRLAELLLDSDIVNQDQIDQALMTSYSSGMPLGSALVLEGVLSPSLFPSILRIQRNIREGRVGREEGISELRSTFLHWIKAEESLARAAEMEDADEMYGQEFQRSQPYQHSQDSGAYPAQNDSQHTGALPQQSGAFAQPSFAPPMYTQPTITAGEGVSRPPDATPAPQAEAAPNRQPESFELKNNSAANGTPRLFDLLQNSGATNHQEVQAAFNRVLEDPIASSKLFKLLGVANDDAIKEAMKSHPLAKQFEELQRKEIVEVKQTHAQPVSDSDEEDDEQSAKPARAPRDRAVLKSTTSKVIGGIVVGAAVAGISSLFKRGKGR